MIEAMMVAKNFFLHAVSLSISTVIWLIPKMLEIEPDVWQNLGEVFPQGEGDSSQEEF